MKSYGGGVMLKRFEFENSYCYKNKVKFDMSAETVKGNPAQLKHPKISEVIRRPGNRCGILPVAAVYGNNASGKTRLIRTLRDAARDALGISFSEVSAFSGSSPFMQMVSERKFLLAESPDNEISYFICVVLKNAAYVKDDKEYKGIEYRLEYTLGENGVVKEEMKRRYLDLTGGTELIYSRNGKNYISGADENVNKYLDLLSAGDDRRLWFSQIAPAMKDNLCHLYNWFHYVRDGLAFNESGQQMKKIEDIAKRIADKKDEDFRYKLLKFLRGLDKSVADIQGRRNDVQGNRFRLLIFHKNREDGMSFAHPIEDESAGTLKLLEQFPLIDRSLELGMPFICEGLDETLHPAVFRRLVDLFNSKEDNPNDAQLIFTAHNTAALDSGCLRRDEVHIVEKDEYSVSKIYRPSDDDMRVKYGE